MLCYFYYVVVNFLKTAKANKIHLVTYLFLKKERNVKCQHESENRLLLIANNYFSNKIVVLNDQCKPVPRQISCPYLKMYKTDKTDKRVEFCQVNLQKTSYHLTYNQNCLFHFYVNYPILL